MKKGTLFTLALIVACLAALAFLSVSLVGIATAQEEIGPCSKPYIKTIFLKAGKPGDEVKIRGRRFGTEEGKVFFSPKVNAQVVRWSNSQLWVVVPQTATTGPVTVSKPCGTVSNGSYFKVIE